MRLRDRHDERSPYRLISKAHSSVIWTSRFIRAEALPYLNAATTLVIPKFPYASAGFNALASIPDDFLVNIASIRVHIDAFANINRRRLPSLKGVHLTHQVEGTDSLPYVVRYLTSKKMPALLEELMKGVFSWKWKMQQFAHLGACEGFDVTMKALWSCRAAVAA